MKLCKSMFNDGRSCLLGVGMNLKPWLRMDFSCGLSSCEDILMTQMLGGFKVMCGSCCAGEKTDYIVESELNYYN